MKLKVTLRAQTGDRDVQFTVDGAATIGDVAAFLSGADGFTLRVTPPVTGQPIVLNALSSIPDSPLRSGCLIEIANPGPTVVGAAVAHLVIESGPDAGERFALAAGTSYLGRAVNADVQLHDPGASRRHAVITITGSEIEVRDLNSGNGVKVDGVRVDRAQLRDGSRIEIGDSTLTLHIAQRAASPKAASADRFSRSPRVEPAFVGETVSAPALPSPPEPPRFPMLAVLAPVVMGAVLFAITRQPVTLLFIALSPVIMLGTWIDNRWQVRRKRREEASKFDADLAALRTELGELAQQERTARLGEAPSTQQITKAILGREPLLWTRKPEHAAFLRVRFGLGTLASRTRVTLPSRPHGSITEWQRLTELVDGYATIDGVPVVENLTTAGSIGVAGACEQADVVARSLVVQLAGLHSPADLVVTAIAGSAVAAGWEWLKWLPHVGSVHSPIRGGLAADYQSAGALLAELESLIDARRAAGGRTEVRSRLSEAAATGRADDAVDREPPTPAVVVLVLGDPPVDRARLVSLGAEGADHGIHLIWVASSVAQLPVICRTYLEVSAEGHAQLGFVRTGRVVPLPMVDLVGAADAHRLARMMAPLADTGSPVLDETDLPGRIAFLDLFDEPVADDPRAVIARWRRSDTLTAAWTPGSRREAGSLRTVVGMGPVEPLHLDLRSNGPHALVGGTTGSGKSEFLQSWILGMATEYSPEQVNFLLVDYKGGAAFADCVGLPHTVGLVTDLSPHLVSRALISLRAELRRREQLLNAKGAKDLETLEQRSDPDTPPALIIVIDEFAALVTEVPEFVDGVIDVAQRGRSLGLHLIMATQRPAGVIRDNLRANTNLRVALRVADESDSHDVIGTAAAAHFDPDTPGRAAAKLGTGRVHDFQTAYLGGWTLPGSDRAADISAADLGFGTPTPWPPRSSAGHEADAPRDIQRLTQSIQAASTALALEPPRRPWLEPLPAILDLGELAAAHAGAPVGLVDLPESQEQLPLTLDLERDGHLLVVGASGSGKSAALRTITATMAAQAFTDPVHVYALDFAGGALAPIDVLPGVGAVITEHDTERTARVLRRLDDLATERSARYSAVGASTLTEYRRLSGDRDEPRVVLLLDGMGAFRHAFEFADRGQQFDRLLRIAGLGRQLGIHLIVTADRSNALPSSLLTSFAQRLILRLAASADYALADADEDALENSPAGRGLLGGREVQLAVPGGAPEPARQSEILTELAARITEAGFPAAPTIDRLPETVALDTLPPTIDGRPALGLDDATLAPIGLRVGGLFVVTGPFRSGRSTALRTIHRSIRSAHPELEGYLVAGRRTELSKLEGWAGVSTNPETAEQLAGSLATELERPEGERDTPWFIVVEQATDFEGLIGEAAIARLIKAARRAEVPIVVESDTVTGAQAWQIYNELKTARAGIILQPEETDGTLFRVQLPRVTRADFPVGRGILVDAGRMHTVQVAH